VSTIQPTAQQAPSIATIPAENISKRRMDGNATQTNRRPHYV